ncbi:signal peptidase I [Bdellovibrio sp. NC01]|uniref:signal peptidase I n=1 Tax=Bdellovibrio sp. NC01 TaxID=2220073 RepID=UPI00115922B6|nr:signal peptidase I [Bdellovibrio sp. NC01]QDK36833.1 signal peptidase I [Bdellovibrio sp. NC01]
MTRWREYFLTLLIAVLFALFVRTYVVTAYKVPTGSMQPTLKPGDFIFSSRMSYGLEIPFTSKKVDTSFPERGDLVVFSYPNQPEINYVKRVVGLPGDRVQVKQGRLILNEEPFEYEKAELAKRDNPNSELFDIYTEKSKLSSWPVIFQKQAEDKDFGPIVVPPGEVFLLGDNRDASDDSRYWGTVPATQVLGKVVLIWLSLDWQKKWGGNRYPSVRWSRVFSSVH